MGKSARVAGWTGAAIVAAGVAVCVSDAVPVADARLTRPGGQVNALSGTALVSQPSLGGGDVAAVVEDGRGGWFVGGLFSAAGGRLRNLVHVRADGTVDTLFRPQPDSGVGALVRRGRTLYVGGYFRRIGGVRRRDLAALDTRTGKAARWAPTMPGGAVGGAESDVDIYALAVAGDVLYVGGTQLAAFDVHSARRIAVPSAFDVMALAVAGKTLYIGGEFTEVDRIPRYGIAAISLRSHQVTWVAPDVHCTCKVFIDGTPFPLGGPPPIPPGPPAPPSRATILWPQLLPPWYVAALAVKGRTLFIGGNFDSVGGEPRRFLAAVDRTTGRPTSFAPRVDGAVLSLHLANNRLYAGTGFGDAHMRPGRYAAAFHTDTGFRTRWNPRPAGPVQAIGVSRRRAFVGGAVARCRRNQSCRLRP